MRPASGARARRFAARGGSHASGVARFILFLGCDGPDSSSQADQSGNHGVFEILNVGLGRSSKNLFLIQKSSSGIFRPMGFWRCCAWERITEQIGIAGADDLPAFFVLFVETVDPIEDSALLQCVDCRIDGIAVAFRLSGDGLVARKAMTGVFVVEPIKDGPQYPKKSPGDGASMLTFHAVLGVVGFGIGVNAGFGISIERNARLLAEYFFSRRLAGCSRSDSRHGIPLSVA